MRNVGDVWIAPLPGGGSEIRYCESVEPDLPITPLMARVVTPLVARELRGEIRGFLDGVREHASPPSTRDRLPRRLWQVRYLVQGVGPRGVDEGLAPLRAHRGGADEIDAVLDERRGGQL